MSVDIWKKKESRKIADCRVFSVREDLSESVESGKTATFYVIENPDWVNVIPITDKRQIVLIEQFRHGSECVTLEIPGGMIDMKETPVECARRELREETGYTADKFVFLGRSNPNPAIQTNWIHHFAAFGCEKTLRPNFDEHENISSRLVDIDKIPFLIESEEITHSLVITGFYVFEAYRRKGPDHIYES